MSAVAVFTCRPNSHPFQERQIPVHEQIKIGRSVARARPAANNAIFDCKVLSRNHALLWYESGKFYLQDTKSSNGTFVNNDRLSKGSEESPPREIYSGDVIQFGVDVMENSRRVTHSCIIASIQLFHPDGQEASNDHSSSFLTLNGGTTVNSQELYQLAQYLQDALHREQMLENKLATLQRLVQSTQDASDSGWQALITEDRLLSRLEVLENQLQVYSGKQSDDTLRQELTALHEDKFSYETRAKESLRKVLEEKLEAVRKLSDLERSLSNTEDECQHLRNMCETSQKELQDLAEKHTQQIQDIVDLSEKLKEEEKKHSEESERFVKEREELESKIQDMIKQEEILQAKIESVQADNDITKEQLANMRYKLDTIQDNTKDPDKIRIPDLISQGVQVEMVNLMDLKLLQVVENNGDSSSDESEKADNDVEMKDASAKEAADVLAQLDLDLDKEVDSDDELRMSEDEAKDGVSDEEEDSEDITFADSSNDLSDLPQFPLDDTGSSLEADHSLTLSPEKLKETQASIKNYKKLLEDSETKLKESQDKIQDLQNELLSAKEKCTTYLERITTLETQVGSSESDINRIMENTLSDMKAQLEESKQQNNSSTLLIRSLKDQVTGLEAEVSTYKSQLSSREEGMQPSEEVEALKELLKEARESVKNKKIEANQLKSELDDANLAIKKSTDEENRLKHEISQAKKLVHEKTSHVDTLKDQLNKAESTTKEVKEQILILREQLLQSQQDTILAKSEAKHLKEKYEELEKNYLRTSSDSAVSGLTTTLGLGMPPKLTTDRPPSPSLLVSKVKRIISSAPQVAVTDKFKQHLPHGEATSITSVAAKQEDFFSLKEECAQLRCKIQNIEKEMKMYRKENHELKTVNEELKHSHNEMTMGKSSPDGSKKEHILNLTDSQKNADLTQKELQCANDNLSMLQEQCSSYQQDMTQLRNDFTDLGEEYTMLSQRSKIISVCSMVPLLMLLVALLLAFYPTLSEVTATVQPGSQY